MKKPKGEVLADRLMKRLKLPKSAKPVVMETIGNAMIMGLETLAETMREANADAKRPLTLTSRPS